MDSNCCLEPVSYAAVEEGGTCGLVIEAVDDADKIGADVVLLHGSPQSCMPNPVEGLLDVYEDMADVLLALEIFSQRIRSLKICSVMLLPALKDLTTVKHGKLYCPRSFRKMPHVKTTDTEPMDRILL